MKKLFLKNFIRKSLIIVLPLCFLSFNGEDMKQVLIIGDSISIGYTGYVKEALHGRAKVYHNPGNAQHTGTGLKKLDKWLGNKKWDVIHFNWGLWDLCYRIPNKTKLGKKDKYLGEITTTPEAYSKNLEQLVQTLESTGANLIFATTTVVPEGEPGRYVDSDTIYNKIAIRIMESHQIPINDLNTVSRRIHKNYSLKKGDVHYTPEGYKELAKHVISLISNNL